MRGWLIALALVLPTVAAHGAPEPREFDTRLLTDTTQIDYGGPEGALGPGGLDLLALDVHEGTLPGSTTPAIVFRAIVQGGEAGNHRIDVHAQAGGAGITLDWTTSDLRSYRSTTFDAVRGPYDVGDGHPKAIEGWVSLSSLGLVPGDAITQILLEGHYDGELQDAMPGGWYLLGQGVPVAPTEDAEEPATYTTSGPPGFFTVAADTGLLPAAGKTRVGLNITSGLRSLDQALTLTATAPGGVNVTVEDDLVPLPAGGAAAASFTVAGAGLGSVRVLVESNLGTAIRLSFPLGAEGDRGAGGNVDSGDLASGGSYQYTFTDAGVFEYHCHPHPWMTAALTIEEAANGTDPATHVVRIVEGADTEDWGFSPADLTIRAGDTVLWVNDGEAVHTIMGSTGLGGHGHHDHDHGDDAEDAPAPAILVPLALALWAARRRG